MHAAAAPDTDIDATRSPCRNKDKKRIAVSWAVSERGEKVSENNKVDRDGMYFASGSGEGGREGI